MMGRDWSAMRLHVFTLLDGPPADCSAAVWLDVAHSHSAVDFLFERLPLSTGTHQGFARGSSKSVDAIVDAVDEEPVHPD